MSANANFGHKYARARDDGRAVYLGGLHFKASRNEIENAAKNFLPRMDHDCIFYWPATASRDGEHSGWCCVEFPDCGAADRALHFWQLLTIKDRPFSVDRAKATSSSSKTSAMKFAASTIKSVEIQSAVTSDKELESLQARMVSLDQVAALEQEGREVWDHSESPLNPVTGKDPRKVDRTEDVITTDRPYMDSDHFFKEEIEIFNRHYPSPGWRPGQLLGPDGSLLEAKASTLSFFSFVPPAQMTNMHSATSNGHALKYLRPQNVGADWGDYDRFGCWQAWGRQLKPEMVEKKDWNKDPLKPMVFEYEDGTTETLDMAAVADYLDPDVEPPMALHEMLRDNRGQGKGGGTRGGYSGRNRAGGPGRGVGRGQGHNWGY